MNRLALPLLTLALLPIPSRAEDDGCVPWIEFGPNTPQDIVMMVYDLNEPNVVSSSTSGGRTVLVLDYGAEPVTLGRAFDYLLHITSGRDC